MDVQRIGKTALHKADWKEEAAKGTVSFKEVIGTRRADMTYERLSRKMQEIESQGKVLAKDFMDDAVKSGLQLEERRGFSQRGSAKVYKLVKEVDQKLLELTNAVLDKEEKGLSLLGMIGEIQGMLINIYT